MRIEDREEFVDMVAQAVIDRIEERDRVNSLVNIVVHRIMEMQKEQAAPAQASSEAEEKPRRKRKTS